MAICLLDDDRKLQIKMQQDVIDKEIADSESNIKQINLQIQELTSKRSDYVDQIKTNNVNLDDLRRQKGKNFHEASKLTEVFQSVEEIDIAIAHYEQFNNQKIEEKKKLLEKRSDLNQKMDKLKPKKIKTDNNYERISKELNNARASLKGPQQKLNAAKYTHEKTHMKRLKEIEKDYEKKMQ